ncbi:MAG: pyrroline-5-carboxylate reductase [Oscillospiraceae bacterium]|jgi:pyrroline-5-carboxylate reductase|nr:pyrroline-5-carboxylate reductase [Oscillospiraceae bacterium]
MARTSKYIAWERYFSGQNDESFAISLEALQNILGSPLPQSAFQRTWWANTPNAPQSKAWTAAGYRVDSFLGNAVTFTRADAVPSEAALKRRGRPPKAAGTITPKKRQAHTPKSKKHKYTKRSTVPAPAAQEKALDLRVSVLGTGNLGSAILQGIAGSRTVNLKAFTLCDKDEAKAAALTKIYKSHLAEDVQDAAANCEILLLTVKPGQIADVLASVNAEIADGKPLVISTAAGWTLDELQAQLPSGMAVARIMPNLNAAVGQSATVYSVNKYVTEEQKTALEHLLKAFGTAQEIDESRFGAHLSLSGAGPAFVYLFADALTRAGVRLGLSHGEALNAAIQTLLGSAENLKASGLHPQELVDKVCSPGGITIEGVLALEETGFAAGVAGAVSAAYEKNLAL